MKDGEVFEGMKLVVCPLQKCELNGFLVKTNKPVEWNFIPSAVSYWLYISEYKNTLAAEHDVEMKRGFQDDLKRYCQSSDGRWEVHERHKALQRDFFKTSKDEDS